MSEKLLVIEDNIVSRKESKKEINIDDLKRAIRLHFQSYGPKNSKLDIRPIMEGNYCRLNWWGKRNGDNDVVMSLFIKVIVTSCGFDFVEEGD